jgi:hypothetical protein
MLVDFFFLVFAPPSDPLFTGSSFSTLRDENHFTIFFLTAEQTQTRHRHHWLHCRSDINFIHRDVMKLGFQETRSGSTFKLGR